MASISAPIGRLIVVLVLAAAACVTPVATFAQPTQPSTEMHVVLIVTMRGVEARQGLRHLLLRATAIDGDRFTETVPVGGAGNAVSFVARRDCVIDQFELVDADMRWIALGQALDGSGQPPRAAAGQTVVIWSVPSPSGPPQVARAVD